MKSTLRQLNVPDSVKGSEAFILTGGYGMNIEMKMQGVMPYPAGQPYRVPELRVMEILSGEASLILNLVRYDLTSGDILVVPSGAIIEPVSLSEDLGARLMSSQSEVVEKPVRIHPGPEDLSELESMMQTIWRALHTEPLAIDVVRFQFLAFLAKVKYLGSLSPEKPGIRADEIFQLFIEAVNTYASQGRRIPFFADKLGITPHHLSSVVKISSGESAQSWIHRAVIQRAKILLDQGQTALQVSEALEFPNAAYFSRYFKRITRITPGEYQKQKKSVR